LNKRKQANWLAEQLGKDPSTVSIWCPIKMQPSLEMLVNIATVLDVDTRELIVVTKLANMQI
jgi:transcriptional regulator with XRE-family HTH domain